MHILMTLAIINTYILLIHDLFFLMYRLLIYPQTFSN
ncbi:unnamed protein product [Brassica oleracea var. botrytis]|uniref:Uncharacterized protein n=1 Tax=Brassica oleracea TaxID=3712 RepID=A0A3P6G1V1_BRAOL|nr:unnamed protein product [Brassica oleracea]